MGEKAAAQEHVLLSVYGLHAPETSNLSSASALAKGSTCLGERHCPANVSHTISRESRMILLE